MKLSIRVPKLVGAAGVVAVADGPQAEQAAVRIAQFMSLQHGRAILRGGVDAVGQPDNRYFVNGAEIFLR